MTLRRLGFLIGLAWVLLVLAPPGSAEGCADPWRVEFDAARTLAAKGKLKNAIEPMSRALDIVRECGPGNKRYKETLRELVRYHNHARSPGFAIEFLEVERTRIEEIWGVGEPSTARLILMVGNEFQLAGRFNLAEKEYRYGVSLAETQPELYADVIVQGLSRLSQLYEKLEQYPEALRLLLESRNIQRRYLESPREGEIRLARLFASNNHFDESAQEYALNLERIRCLGRENLRTRQEYAEVLRTLGRDQQAEAVLSPRTIPEPVPAEVPRPDMIFEAGKDGVSNPCFLKKVTPVYPEQARVKRVGGQVVIRAVFLHNGTVGPTKVVRCSLPDVGFEGAAVDAVKQWRFEPLTKDGQPVDAYFMVVIDFSLH